MLTTEVLRERLSGKSLEGAVDVLEKALVKYKPGSYSYHNDQYYDYISAVISSDLPTSIKKSLIQALHGVGLPLSNRRWYYGDVNSPFYEAVKIRDLELLLFMRVKLGMPFNLNDDIRGLFHIIAKNKTDDDNTFIIQLLTTPIVPTSIAKTILYGAIEGRNMTIVEFIVDGLKFPLFTPTHQISRVGSLAAAFIENDDVEMVKWFVERGYNVHECQRYMREEAYKCNKPLLLEYINEDQAKMEASDLYMEKMSNLALQKGDAVFLAKYPKLGCAVTYNMLERALSYKKPTVCVQSLFERYIELNQSRRFERMHVTRMYNITKIHPTPELWNLAKKYLVTHGTQGARDRIVSLETPVNQPNSELENSPL